MYCAALTMPFLVCARPTITHLLIAQKVEKSEKKQKDKK